MASVMCMLVMQPNVYSQDAPTSGFGVYASARTNRGCGQGGFGFCGVPGEPIEDGAEFRTTAEAERLDFTATTNMSARASATYNTDATFLPVLRAFAQCNRATNFARGDAFGMQGYVYTGEVPTERTIHFQLDAILDAPEVNSTVGRADAFADIAVYVGESAVVFATSISGVVIASNINTGPGSGYQSSDALLVASYDSGSGPGVVGLSLIHI